MGGGRFSKSTIRGTPERRCGCFWNLWEMKEDGRDYGPVLPARFLARPAARLEGQGRTGPPAARSPRRAHLHPGEDSPPNYHREPSAACRRLRGQDRFLSPRSALDEPDDPWRQPAGDDQPGREGAAEGASADDLLRPALRHQVRLELAGQHPQSRRKGRQGRTCFASAGADQGIPRHLAVRHPLLPDLPPGPVYGRPRSAH